MIPSGSARDRVVVERLRCFTILVHQPARRPVHRVSLVARRGEGVGRVQRVPPYRLAGGLLVVVGLA